MRSLDSVVLFFWLSFTFCRAFLGSWFNILSDCDEVFNFWEPTRHVASKLKSLNWTRCFFSSPSCLLSQFSAPQQISNAFALQTWEYSPTYALRSYLYVLAPASFTFFFEVVVYPLLPVFLQAWGSGVLSFLIVRTCLSIVYGCSELFFVQSLTNRIGKQWSHRFIIIYLIINVTSPGIFLASNQFLPTTTFTLFFYFAMGCYLRSNTAQALCLACIGTLISWPFAGLLYVILGCVALYRRGFIKTFLPLFLSGILTLLVVAAFDVVFYGTWVLSPLRLVLYNTSFGSGQGKSTLYGVEHWTFYIKNLLLNFHVYVFGVVLGVLRLSYLLFLRLLPKPFWHTTTAVPLYGLNLEQWSVVGLPLVIWFAFMSCIPHKEERFLVPMYPSFVVLASLGVDWVYASTVAWTRTCFKKKPSEIQPRSPSPAASSYQLSLAESFNRLRQRGAAERLSQKKTARSSNFPLRVGQLPFSRHLSWCCVKLLPLCIVTLLCVSRIVGLYMFYGAPVFDIWSNVARLPAPAASESLATAPVNRVCTGAEWYRYPSSFFLPSSNGELGFIRSSFKGLLPTRFTGTATIPKGLNDDNKENPALYSDILSCSYIVESTDNATSFGPRSDVLKSNNVELVQHPHTGQMAIVRLKTDSAVQQWRTMKLLKCTRLLDAKRTGFPFRSFYFPWLGRRKRQVVNYCLWKLVAETS